MRHVSTRRPIRPPRWLCLAFPSLLVVILLLVTPTSAWAHPLGNFSINRYSLLELGAEQVQLYYVIDMAEIPAFQERELIDADGDGLISPAEQAQYLASQIPVLQSNLQLFVGGMWLELEPQERLLEFPPGEGGLLTLRLSVRFVATLPHQQPPWQGEYRDDNYADRLGWQEIVVLAGSNTVLLESTAPAQDLSQGLRSYPQDLLETPPVVNSARFRFKPEAPSTESGASIADPEIAAQTSQPIQGRGGDRFAELIAIPALRPGVLLLALVTAFGWGAMHSLTPGHGKTIVAAYLVGSQGTARHALFLGLTTTVTHTAGVFVLGFLTLFASQSILPEQLYPWLGVISGGLVVAIGLSLFGARLCTLTGPGVYNHNDDHNKDHSHSHDYDHDHDHSHGHLPPGADGSPVTWRSLLALGVSGGLLPCPSALVVMLSAIALQRIGFGLLLIVVFSLGLASVLTAIGVLFVHAGRLFERIPMGGRLIQALPVASALFITIVGVGITLRAIAQTGVLQF